MEDHEVARNIQMAIEGKLWRDCSCCGHRLGGSTTDAFALCKRCAKVGCNWYTRTPKCS